MLEENDLKIVFIHDNDYDYKTLDSLELVAVTYKIPLKQIVLKKAIKEGKFLLNKDSFTPVTFILNSSDNVISHLYGDYDVCFIENEILKHL